MAFQSFIKKKKTTPKTKQKKPNKLNLMLFQQHDSNCLQILCYSLCVPLGSWKANFSVPNCVKEAKLKKNKARHSKSEFYLDAQPVWPGV